MSSSRPLKCWTFTEIVRTRWRIQSNRGPMPGGPEPWPDAPAEISGAFRQECRRLFGRALLSRTEKRFEAAPKEYVERLKYELKVIRDMAFSDYILIVWDFMKFAHDNGIITGPGRGSAAGSLVAYTLFITDVDPLKHKLLFERF
ncbi:hypothetical protein PO124_09500 [Bacillus licheniformis]|nr:hypothetical protein [Bacillus licheniformis]